MSEHGVSSDSLGTIVLGDTIVLNKLRYLSKFLFYIMIFKKLIPLIYILPNFLCILYVTFEALPLSVFLGFPRFFVKYYSIICAILCACLTRHISRSALKSRRAARRLRNELSLPKVVRCHGCLFHLFCYLSYFSNEMASRALLRQCADGINKNNLG